MSACSLVAQRLGLELGSQLITRIPTPRRLHEKSVASLLERVPGSVARRLLEVLANVSWTADLDRMTVGSMMNMVRRQGGLRTMLSTRGGAQDTLIEEGIGFISEHLTGEVALRVRTGHRVTAIWQDDARAIIETTGGEVTASKVIVTVLPPMAKRIRFDPPLPRGLIELQQCAYMGSVFDAIGVYEQPFWRNRAGGDLIVLDEPARGVFDSGSPDGPGHLVILVGGPPARTLDALDPARRREILLEDLAPQMGREVLVPASWPEKSWHLDGNAGGVGTRLFPASARLSICRSRTRPSVTFTGPAPRRLTSTRLSRRRHRGRSACG